MKSLCTPSQYCKDVESYLIKFLLLILGALTAAPTSEDPVNQIPHAAPTTDNPKPNAMPKLAYPYGDIWVRTSDHPWLQNSDVQVEDVAMVDFVCFVIVFVVSAHSLHVIKTAMYIV